MVKYVLNTNKTNTKKFLRKTLREDQERKVI